MARRPIFFPNSSGALVQERQVDFEWHPGLSVQQKRRSAASLRQAADGIGLGLVLEVSSKSETSLGRSLSAFDLVLDIGEGKQFPVEAAFQGSKVFEQGGPHHDMYGLTGKQLKKDERLKDSGELKKFDFLGDEWGLQPKTAFYDWLYVNALSQHPDLAAEAADYAAFSDIEFNPKKSVNCQARSLALFISLKNRDLLKQALSSKHAFLGLLDEGGCMSSLFGAELP